jgi:hypothetical protein
MALGKMQGLPWCSGPKCVLTAALQNAHISGLRFNLTKAVQNLAKFHLA